MKYHINDLNGHIASFKHKDDRDNVYYHWLNEYGENNDLMKEDDIFEEFSADCASKCFGGCMRDNGHRPCKEDICKQWRKRNE